MIHLNHLTLDLKGSGIKPIKEFVANISKMIALTSATLDFGCNKIDDEVTTELAEAFGALTEMRHLILFLGDNAIGDTGIKALATELEKLSNITLFGLEIMQNEVQDEGATALANSLKTLTNLTNLSLDVRCKTITDRVSAMG